MISLEFSESITETLDILNHMEKAYIDKIPKKFIAFLENNKSNSYIPNLNHSKKINEMQLKEKTKNILATIYMNYWCNSEQKSNYANLLKQNEEKYQEELREKYNPDNLFKNKTETIIEKAEPVQEEIALVEVKENFFTKFIKKLKNILNI